MLFQTPLYLSSTRFLRTTVAFTYHIRANVDRSVAARSEGSCNKRRLAINVTFCAGSGCVPRSVGVDMHIAPLAVACGVQIRGYHNVAARRMLVL